VHVVAIHRLQGNEELLARELAALLGKTVAESRGRVRVAGTGPAVVGTFAHEDAAAAVKAELASHGFDILELSDERVEAASHHLAVDRVDLAPAAAILKVGRDICELPYAEVEIILSGSAAFLERVSVATRQRAFRSGFVMMTVGPLLMAAKVTHHKVVRQERFERLLLVQPKGDHPAFVFREESITFGDIGVPLVAASAGNLAAVSSQLRERCRTARYDDRLENRMVQRQILGTLDPHRHLDIAIALLIGDLRAGGAIGS
jgi:hypothetical protein